ncbi:MFS general substrate transporter [Mucidula mucida]|nr:MFS general substrate transporter [Mucidula mucida]
MIRWAIAKSTSWADASELAAVVRYESVVHLSILHLDNGAEYDDSDGDKRRLNLGLKSQPSSRQRPNHTIAHDDFPDGGLRAWLVVFGGLFFCFLCYRLGYVNSWGVFQSYYQTGLLKDTPPSNIAWIGSIQYCLVFFPAFVAGRLFDLGYWPPVFLGCSVLLVTATFLIGQCHEYWQFLLCQGFAVGIACGGIMSPTTAVLAHWFKRRRGLATGLMAVGSSIGGTIIPIAARNLIPKVGFPWTMRIIGFILLVGLATSNMLVKRRLPPPPFSFYCASTFVLFFGMYTVLTYIDVSAVSHGIDENFSFYLVAIVNASSAVGRYCAGGLADRMGAMNVMIPFTTASAVVTIAWPFAVTKGGLIAIAVVYGFPCSLIPVMEFGDTSDVGRRVGMTRSIMSLGALVGPPISGGINSKTGGFEAVGYYAGSAILVGVGLMLASRYYALKGFYGKM